MSDNNLQKSNLHQNNASDSNVSSEWLSELIVECAQEGILVISGNGRIIRINQIAKKILGFTNENLQVPIGLLFFGNKKNDEFAEVIV